MGGWDDAEAPEVWARIGARWDVGITLDPLVPSPTSKLTPTPTPTPTPTLKPLPVVL